MAETHARNATTSAPPPGSAWAEALAGLGALEQQPPTEREAYLWPDNVQAWACWVGVQTQWRTGMAGATGLDYAGVRAYLHEQPDIEREARPDIFRGIQAAERATLEVWADQRERERDEQQAAQHPAARVSTLR